MSIVDEAPRDAAETATATASKARPGAGPRQRGSFRADIQSLRALAVVLVVLNHLWPSRITGGYVGVDVFFVISGFLITSHLFKELTATGKVRLASFYARRIRRLLPAAFLVLAVSLAASMIWLPFSRWVDTACEVLASALYAENWVLAAKSVDYSASTASATVAQHYWSLSVEEQFYLVWPVLLMVLFGLAARRGKPMVRAVFAGIAAVTVLGLMASVLTTELSPNQAYFVTPVRAWEFGAGALAALAAGRVRLPSLPAKAAGLAGYLLIGYSALAFSEATPFPGWLAVIPVLGTVMAIIAGSDNRRPALNGLISWAPLQYLGNISYSLYLWHWPIIVIAPFALGRPLATLDKGLIIVAAVLLAGLTKVLVEDRGQSSKFLTSSNLRTFVAMSAGMALLAGLVVFQLQATDQHTATAERAAAAAALQPCHGPRALLPGSDCADRFGPSATPVMAKPNQYWNLPPECGQARDELMSRSTKTHLRCDFSGGRDGAPVVWLVGDSHGQQWQAMVFAAAKTRHWIVKTALLGGCPVADIKFKGYDGNKDPAVAEACMGWAHEVTDAVAADRPSAVFTSMFARKQAADDGSGKPRNEQFATGLNATWKHWTDAGAKVYVLADPPLNQAVRPPDCTTLHAAAPAECAVDRKAAQPEDPLTLAARISSNGNVRLLDFTDFFCTPGKCYTVVGGVNVYYDANHLNRGYSELLAPILLDRIS
ncbi:acyltransferase family protein [Micrococcaceae bacterium Sec5.7]